MDYADGAYHKTLGYNAKGLLASEQMWIDMAPQVYTVRYGYDAYDRPSTTTYPDGDVVKITGYDSGRQPTGLTSTLGGQVTTLVDGAVYDAAGRLVSARYGGSGGPYVTHNYYPWVSADGNGNGRYRGLSVGGAPGKDNVLSTAYGYDTFGNPVAYETEQGGVRQDITYFNYDGQNRLKKGYEQVYTWQARGALATFASENLGYDSAHIHAVTTAGTAGTAGTQNRYSYNANGSMVTRTPASGPAQQLKWDSHHRLAQVSSSSIGEGYFYNESGVRLRKATGTGGPILFTFYPFAGFEQTNTGVVTKHYSFNGVHVAVRTSSGVSLLYADGVNSTVYTTNRSGAVTAARRYFPFGATRYSAGAMPTDRHFTGQQEDATADAQRASTLD